MFWQKWFLWTRHHRCCPFWLLGSFGCVCVWKAGSDVSSCYRAKTKQREASLRGLLFWYMPGWCWKLSAPLEGRFCFLCFVDHLLLPVLYRHERTSEKPCGTAKESSAPGQAACLGFIWRNIPFYLLRSVAGKEHRTGLVVRWSCEWPNKGSILTQGPLAKVLNIHLLVFCYTRTKASLHLEPWYNCALVISIYLWPFPVYF